MTEERLAQLRRLFYDEGLSITSVEAHELFEEIDRLQKRQATHLKLIADMSKNEATSAEALELRAQIGTLMATIGSLKSELRYR